MSYSDQHGEQIDPRDLTGSLVVRFNHATAHTTVEAMGARLGLATDQVAQTIQELVDCGFLVELEDGSYTANMDAEVASVRG